MPEEKGALAQDKGLTRINRELEEKATQERASNLKLPYLDVGSFPINPDILHLVTPEEAGSGILMLYFKRGKALRVALAHPTKPETVAVIKKLEARGFTVDITLSSESSILQAFRLYASDQYRLKAEVKNVVRKQEVRYEKELENLSVLKDKLIKLPSEDALNLLNVSAIRAGASDIHYQPEEGSCFVRFRIDGVLHPVFDLPLDIYANLAGQLKYQAKMKLNVTNVPQDGRYRFVVNDEKIDVRVASLPTEYGESFVCRILQSSKKFGSFEELGFAGRPLEILKKAEDLTQGMILITGPTSSGKTTTLYVLLQRFNKPDLKMTSLEDPIEYHLPGIVQSQVNEKMGYTFADGLRTILRQDPDIVMIGEVRDLETAQVVTQAALTGHILLSTLHTNSAIEAIPRLLAMGIAPFVLAPAVSVVVAQRLIRRLCEACASENEMSSEERSHLEKVIKAITAADSSQKVEVPSRLKKRAGCEACNFTGFRGQMVICEALLFDEEIKELILRGALIRELTSHARKSGMLTMYEDAVLKVLAGLTTLEEVHRVVSG